MKSFQLTVLAGILAATSSVAMASSGSLNEFKPQTLSVLVHVNAQGKVTDASPAMELTPALRRLLMSNLDEVISKPATRHGRPVASQFVANMVLQVTPRDEGDYEAHFAYLSSSPVPSGSWYWVHIDGHRLALADRNGSHRQAAHDHPGRHLQRQFNNTNSRPASPPPPVQNTTRGASGNSPAQGSQRGH